jgi:hypothetical protein
MKRRTILEIEEEIDEIELQILDVKKSIHEDEPDWREPHRRRTGDLAPGYVPLAERRKRVELLQAKVDRLKKEKDALVLAQGSPTGGKMGHGELKQTVSRLAARDGFNPGKTVPSATISKWVREIQNEGKTTTAASIRAQLTNLGITKERVKKKD